MCNRLVKILFSKKLPAASTFAESNRIKVRRIFFNYSINPSLDLVGRYFFLHESKCIIDQLREVHCGQRPIAGEQKGFYVKNEIACFHLVCSLAVDRWPEASYRLHLTVVHWTGPGHRPTNISLAKQRLHLQSPSIR